MTDEQLQKVQSGDILRNLGSGEAYIVTSTHFDGEYCHHIVVRQIEASNASEWMLVKRGG